MATKFVFHGQRLVCLCLFPPQWYVRVDEDPFEVWGGAKKPTKARNDAFNVVSGIVLIKKVIPKKTRQMPVNEQKKKLWPEMTRWICAY